MHTLQNAHNSITYYGHAIPQVLSYSFLDVEVYIPSQGHQCHICGGQSSTRAGFSPRLQFYPDNHDSIKAPLIQSHASSSSEAGTLGKLGAKVPGDYSASP
jgi:hypothetical protein